MRGGLHIQQRFVPAARPDIAATVLSDYGESEDDDGELPVFTPAARPEPASAPAAPDAPEAAPGVDVETNASYSGWFYQNAYQQLHRHLRCAGRCALSYAFPATAGRGVMFSFFQRTASSDFDNALVVTMGGVPTEISKFKYVAIPTPETGSVDAVLFLQTLSFEVGQANITGITIKFVGEILVDDVAVYR